MRFSLTEEYYSSLNKLLIVATYCSLNSSIIEYRVGWNRCTMMSKINKIKKLIE